jgi:hypothetical protein
MLDTSGAVSSGNLNTGNGILNPPDKSKSKKGLSRREQGGELYLCLSVIRDKNMLVLLIVVIYLI